MIFKFIDKNGKEGVCDIEQHSNLIVVTELAENTGMDIINSCGEIVTQYCEQSGIRPWELIYFERYDERSGERYANENPNYFSVKLSSYLKKEVPFPTWVKYNEPEFKAVLENYKSKEMVEGLYEDQVIHSGICPRCGVGRASINTALSRRAKVMICNNCGTEEAMMDVGGEAPMLFSNWVYIRKLNGLPPFVASIMKGE